ncbi:DUF817 domain-containing protein [Brachybacterium fresconis]|uniref:Uncharacterized membrane protein YoaT (DUF817 family) n=1 Tax=Brachybacterium fresconis TaxID=173363 RepID=A0ABS4YMK9_9MICO|nr:DUF817 domain-containing protein [Brachybacterium fresconis]MBP2410031.1 uncharacterized membrane protein YoaT (DUF817 family) [Brachybacterium fresconis]
MDHGHRGFTPLEERLDAWAHRRSQALAVDASRLRRGLLEFAVFTVKQAWACVFGAAMLVLLVLAGLLYPDGALLVRGDALVIAAVTVQAAMLVLRLEGGRELWVIMIFHVVGTAMEVFKTHVGSWSYETDGLLRIGGVPLYSGFMYAAVGSYMVRVMRLFDLRFVRYPPIWTTALVAAAIYANFFTHHYLPDARWVLLLLVAWLYAPCVMTFRNRRGGARFRMPILLAFVGVAFFLWIAENVGTWAGAWIYPHQAAGWQLVPLTKFVSWLLLMMISVVLVTFVHRPREPDAASARNEEGERDRLRR